jgi:ferredoxin-NADP reductase
MVMGGIGITPAMSMLRTLRDDGDTQAGDIDLRQQVTWGAVTFREELDALSREH